MLKLPVGACYGHLALSFREMLWDITRECCETKLFQIKHFLKRPFFKVYFNSISFKKKNMKVQVLIFDFAGQILALLFGTIKTVMLKCLSYTFIHF